jgi:hypothetical protein
MNDQQHVRGNDIRETKQEQGTHGGIEQRKQEPLEQTLVDGSPQASVQKQYAGMGHEHEEHERLQVIEGETMNADRSQRGAEDIGE